MKFEESVLQKEWENGKEAACVDVASLVPQSQYSSGSGEATPSDAALGALLEDAEPSDDDAERRVRRLGSRLARLDALNVGGMLSAATESGGAGAALAQRLEDGLGAGAALSQRLRRYDALVRAAPTAPHARTDAARADTNARVLLTELTEVYNWLDAPPLRDLDSLAEVSLTSAEGRERALAAGEALRTALRAEASAPASRRRLAAVRERLRRLARAKDQLAAALARHLNNALIHLGNEAAHDAAHKHHPELLPYAPFMRWLKDMDEKAYDALAKVYVSTWSRVYERAVRAACDAARAPQSPPRADEPLDNVLSLVENLCNAEQDFCVQFFFLDVDVKGEGSDGESETGRARGGGEARRFMTELFPTLEADLVALVNHHERQDPYGAMRALACVGRRVLSGGTTTGSESRWARAALAGVAVAAKRGADRQVADRLSALPDAVKQAAKKPKCGILSFVSELEQLSSACEAIFASSGRRADLDRWSDSEVSHVSDYIKSPAIDTKVAPSKTKPTKKTVKRKASPVGESESSNKKPGSTDLFGLEDLSSLPTQSGIASSLLTRVANGKVRRVADLQGAFYIELKVYNKGDIISTAPEERWKKAEVALKLQLDKGSPQWNALQKFMYKAHELFNDSESVYYSDKIHFK